MSEVKEASDEVSNKENESLHGWLCRERVR